MSLLGNARLIATALVACATPAVAKEIKGTPKGLIGTYGKNADQCRSYNRKDGDGLVVIAKDRFSECKGDQCKAAIVSHQTTTDGITLNLRFKQGAGTAGQTRRITRTGYDQITLGNGAFAGETLQRCTTSDVIAGVGVPTSGEKNIEFAYYYGRTAARLCPYLIFDSNRLLFPNYRRYGIDDEAEAAAKADKQELSRFCDHALRTLGRNDTVISGLVRIGSWKPNDYSNTAMFPDGSFSDDPALCNREMHGFVSASFNTCSGFTCANRILRHDKTSDGWILKVEVGDEIGPFSGKIETVRLTNLDKDTIRYQTRGQSITFKRCPKTPYKTIIDYKIDSTEEERQKIEQWLLKIPD